MKTTNLPKIIAVVGPTASGKSKLALDLAQALEGEIICTDSMQVYQEMNIGTAKPTQTECNLIPHHQLDLVKPDEHYSVGQYERDASQIIKHLHQQNKLIILVGGTGLYFRGLLYGLCEIPQISLDVKNQVDQWYEDGLDKCYHELVKQDPESAHRLHKNDTTRILRALEVILQTGQSIQQFQKDHTFAHQKYPFFSVGYWHERAILYERINNRTHIMLENGWIEETENLLKRYPSELKPLQAIGYSQIIQYLLGGIPQKQISKEEMVSKIQQKTRNYAKRQITWFKKDMQIKWFSDQDQIKVFDHVKAFVDGKASI